MVLFCLTSGLLAWNPTATCRAEAYTPNNDEQILEQLPVTNQNPLQRRIGKMRNALKQDPHNLELAIELARSYIKLGKAQADPRYYGYAQGALIPWWGLSETPSEVLLLRASILQHRHDFAGALLDLERLLAREPRNTRAWQARAMIMLVRAEYQEAQRSCIPLLEFDRPLQAATCLSQIGALTGHAADSFTLLSEALADAPAAPDEQRVWTLTVLATIASQLDQNRQADRIFRQALALQPWDVYLLNVYADYLLDEDRPSEVVSLLKDKTRIDSLLLRLALAKQRLGSDDLEKLLVDLERRFAESRLRGENQHQADEARFRLVLRKQARYALRLAHSNWNVQRQPQDMRILLETALAAQNPDAARPVLDLLTQTALEHPMIQALAMQLRALQEK